MSDCLFCKIISGDIPSDQLYSDERIVAFRDIDPVAPFHILVVPRKHITTPLDMQQEDAELIGQITLIANQIARDNGLDKKGYRLVWNCKQDGGQSVYHIHLHLLGGRQMEWPPG